MTELATVNFESAFDALDAREEQVAIWGVMPKGERVTAAQLAQKLEMNDATVYKILARPRVQEAIFEARRFLLNSQALGDFWVQLLDYGKADETAAFKLARMLLDAGIHPFGSEAARGNSKANALDGRAGSYERIIHERGTNG